jgi:hypothetical protein
MSENEFKKKELERLLSENKITLEQYLNSRAKLEKSPVSSDNTKGWQPPTLAGKAQKAKKPAKAYAKIAAGAILCVVVLVSVVVFMGWSANGENLTIETYDLGSFASKGVLSFTLKNYGATDIRIASIKMNGYPNQSSPGLTDSTNAWIGTLYLKPNSEGTIYVNLPFYFSGFFEAMFTMSSPHTETEIANFYSTMNSSVCRFTFITSTNREYSIEVPGLFSTTTAWMGEMTVGFMGTAETLNVGNPWGWDLDTGTCNITMTNTGGSTVTINTVRVSGSTAIATNASAATGGDLPLYLSPGASCTLRIQAPASHQFKVGVPTTITIVTHGNKEFSATGTPPSA